jgi:hypothetical protein
MDQLVEAGLKKNETYCLLSQSEWRELDGQLMQEMVAICSNDGKPPVLETDDVYLFEEAKLTTKKRKSLKSSTFCGPDKSFPVNDCAHYTAALRLIGRYKGPGDKNRIRACVIRRGKAMGCTGAGDEERSDIVAHLTDLVVSIA